MEQKTDQLQKTENHIQLVNDNQLIEYLDTMGLSKELTKEEKNNFLQICKAFNLNPFKREIYCSKYNGQTTIITGYEVYIKRAERSGLLDGWEVTTEGKVSDNSLKAIITIYRKDRKYAFKHEVLYSEYVQTTREGKVTKFWQKSFTMIKKVAIAQGFRLCFSDELGGIPYTQDEMPEIVHHEVIYDKEAEQKELCDKYLEIIDSATHVFTAEEQDNFSKDKKGVACEKWQIDTLKSAIVRILNLISDRENDLLSEEQEKINSAKTNIE